MQVWEVLSFPHHGVLATAIRQLDEPTFAQAISNHLLQQVTVANTFCDVGPCYWMARRQVVILSALPTVK